MIKTGLLLKWSLALFLGLGTITTMAYYAEPEWAVSIFEYPQSIYDSIFKWPKAPEIVDEDLDGSCGVRIFWVDNELNEDGVYFYRRVVGEPNFTAIDARPPHPGVPGSFDDDNLPMGTYEYKVSVFNEYHETFSNVSAQMIIDEDVCGDEPIVIKPLNPVITSLERVKGDTCTIRVYFNDNSTDEDGIRIYRSEWNDPDVLLAELPPNNGPTGSYDDTNIPPGHYTYRVSVFNENGESFSTISDEIEMTEEACGSDNILVLTPNPSLISTPAIQAQACVWKAAVNVFLRKGPDVGAFDRLVDVEAGKSFPVVGQSEDGQFWAVEVEPGVIGYISKSEKFSIVDGDCLNISVLTDPEPAVVEPVATKKPGDDTPSTPQCSDGIDNDGDRIVDMRDRGCSSPDDTSE
ncbi:MAG: hypothetical protein JNM55_11180 [Anaerolineales bacterium]|nr:hypothetical protein [Anaerolineales bacterium]